MMVLVGLNIENLLHFKGTLKKKSKAGEILCSYEYKYKTHGGFRLLVLI